MDRLNLRLEPLWASIKPIYGLAQRALFAAWFGWCALLGLLLRRRRSL